MKTVTWYITKQVLGMTLLAALVLCFMVWLFRSLQVVDMVLNRGISLTGFLYFASLLFPRFLLLVAPMAVFGAALFTYNKMIGDSELVVMRSAGLSQMALAKPAIIIGLAISLLSIFMSTYFVPLTFREYKELQLKYRNDLPKLLLQKGVFSPMADGVTVYFRDVAKNGALLDVLVHDNRDRIRPETYMAKRGLVHEGKKGQWVLTLKDFSVQYLANPKKAAVCGPRALADNPDRTDCSPPAFERAAFSDANHVEFDFFTGGESSLYLGPRERMFVELLDPTIVDPRLRRDMQAELHYRLAMPLLPLTCAVIGIAILLSGSFSRRGQFKLVLMAVIAAAGVIIATHLLRNYATQRPWLIAVMYATVLLPLLIGLLSLAAPRQLPRGGPAAPQ
ncbi:MAG: LptF/LptG family permease [Alphaproteobacteria bacterium]|nr:LptF/LptG family permease [Alphaproteobacteria bacterium]